MAKKTQGILTDHQKKVLELMGKESYFTRRFYFTGGTAPAEFYLQHRFSEDLDFFSERREVNPIFISHFLGAKKKILRLGKLEPKEFWGYILSFCISTIQMS